MKVGARIAANAADASGVAFCSTTVPREHPMGIVTLGSLGISIPPYAQDATATGTCSNLSATGEDITIVAARRTYTSSATGLRPITCATGSRKGSLRTCRSAPGTSIPDGRLCVYGFPSIDGTGAATASRCSLVTGDPDHFKVFSLSFAASGIQSVKVRLLGSNTGYVQFDDVRLTALY